MLKIISAVWGFITDAVAGFFQWLRKPGSLLRGFCGVLAVGCAVLALGIYDQRTQVHELTVAGLRCEAEVAGARGKVEGWDAAVAQIRDGLMADALERERQLERSRAALAQAQADRAEAERRSQLFTEKYDNRSEQCAAALQSLDTVCADLGGY